MNIENSKSQILFWKISLEELFGILRTRPKGLSSIEAQLRLAEFGHNLINTKKKQLLIIQFLKKFKNPLVIVLLIASSLSAFTKDEASFYIICFIIIISVTLDFVQEFRAGRATEKLEKSVAVSVHVLRDENLTELSFFDLVPGDVVTLTAGDLVPCDGRVLECKDFFVDQSHLTGEAFPVEKFNSDTIDAPDALTAINCVLLGSSVVSGSAKILMCRTGRDTNLGEIAESLMSKAPPTDFETGVQSFGFLIMRMTVFLCLFVLMVNTFLHRPWLDSFLFSLALAVGLTPELLPMVVSVTLSKGALRLAQKKVIVKKLSSIHNLGSMDVLCTDKTGTLTESRIHLERHVDPEGYESQKVIKLAYYNSYFESGLRSPLDTAILQHTHLEINNWTKIDEVPFDFERRRVSVLLDDGANRLLVVKGAPEDILLLSKYYETKANTEKMILTDDVRISINREFENLSRDGFRVLGIAYKNVGREHNHAVVNDESELIFAGFAGFLDPPKESARLTLKKLSQDRVEVKIITGDNKLVAENICRQLQFKINGIITGTEIQEMNDESLAAIVQQTNIFCRMNPSQKNRIILALKKRGHVVGYLGDGINDAPSLHAADVGISVDSAVDVAKSAADMILLEHDLSILHAGILEGRRTYGNIMKYIMMGTSSNFGNMFSMAIATLFLPFIPMLPVQILLNNLLYDFSELPIPLDRVDNEFISRPHRWNMKFIRNFMLIIGPISSVFDLITFYIMIKIFHANEALFHTGWFIESMATQVLAIFVIRTRGNPFKSKPHPLLIGCSVLVVTIAVIIPFTYVGNRLGFVEPTAYFFIILAVMLLGYLYSIEVAKQWFFKKFSD